jgi:hypothetical protein
MKGKFVGLAFVVCCLCAFWLGHVSGKRKTGTYVVNGYTVAFDRSAPVYGLPITEYASVLTLLRNGKQDVAIARLEALMDMALFDAKARRAVLDGDALARLDKGIHVVAAYRKQFPRALPPYSGTNDPSYLVVSQMMAVDALLRKFQQ